MNLTSSYQAILRRPALAKFMVVPHYAYLKMKLPSPCGIITVVRNYKKSSECALAGSKLAESLVIAEEQRRSTGACPSPASWPPCPSPS